MQQAAHFVWQVPILLAQGLLQPVHCALQACILALRQRTAHLACLGVTPLPLGRLHQALAFCVGLVATSQALAQLPVQHVLQAATSQALGRPLQPSVRFALLGATPLPLELATFRCVLLAATPQAQGQLLVTHVQQAATSQALVLQPPARCAWLGATPPPPGLSTSLFVPLAATPQAQEQLHVIHVQQAATSQVLV